MMYISTRGGAKPATFNQVLLAGLAPDGGLYVPEQYPKFTEAELNRLRNYEYHEVAMKVLRKFCFEEDIPHKDLGKIIFKTYTKKLFGSGSIVPIKKLEDGLYLLKLSEGPTLAFKDVALQLVANLMEYVLEKESKKLNILAATSGDTGSAAAYALRGKKGINLFVLSPDGDRMSQFQQKQMWTLDEQNIFNLVVDAPFDTLQAIVKKVNADSDFVETFDLGAVNSINWARIVAQVVYYVYAFLQVTKDNKEYVTFAVPSGNFGNALAAYVAKRMGLPIGIIVCTNENDVLDQFFRKGVYRARGKDEVKVTSSPSMDIAVASNFERLMYDYLGPELMLQCWEDLEDFGSFDLKQQDPVSECGMYSGKATDAEVLQTIRSAYADYAILIDPHTAVAMKVGLQNRHQVDGPLVIVETAQPVKFQDTIKKALGFSALSLDEHKQLMEGKENVFRLQPDAEVVKDFIRTHVK